MSSLEVRTLRQSLESDQVIDCGCSNYWLCSHTGALRIEMAVQRLGREFDFYVGREVLAAHVYCSVCGSSTPHSGLAGRRGRGLIRARTAQLQGSERTDH